MNELIPFAQLEIIAQSAEAFPVDFDLAWQWVGYSRKDVALETLKKNFAADLEFSGLNRKTPKGSKGGRPEEKYYLTTDCFKAFCMMAGTEKGKEVRRYYLDIEKRFLSIVQNAKIARLIRRDFNDAIQASGLNITTRSKT
jgi:phage anti-repressor protein